MLSTFNSVAIIVTGVLIGAVIIIVIKQSIAVAAVSHSSSLQPVSNA
jgi:hypothetical protein